MVASARTMLSIAAVVFCLAGLFVCTEPVLAEQEEPEFPREWYFHDIVKNGDEVWASHAELIGKPMPELKLSQWMNGELKPEDLKGKVVVIDFWATWCGPCLAAIPHTNEMQEEYGEQGLVIIGVCGSGSGQEKMADVAKKHKIQYPIARDETLESAELWQVKWWPTYGVVDRKGNLRALGLRPNHVDAVVEKLLAEPVPEDEEGEAKDESVASAR